MCERAEAAEAKLAHIRAVWARYVDNRALYGELRLVIEAP
jgi:hypothetical protein